jgi:chemotaxis signal transduction protein
MHDRSDIQSFIVFKVIDHTLALPIAAVLKVVNRASLETTPELAAMGLVQIGRHLIRVMNLHQRLETTTASWPLDTFPFWIIIRAPEDGLLGIPVDEPPDMMAFPADSVRSLPPTLSQTSPVDAIARHIVMLNRANAPQAIVLLDLNRALSQPTPSLPALPG